MAMKVYEYLTKSYENMKIFSVLLGVSHLAPLFGYFVAPRVYTHLCLIYTKSMLTDYLKMK